MTDIQVFTIPGIPPQTDLDMVKFRLREMIIDLNAMEYHGWNVNTFKTEFETTRQDTIQRLGDMIYLIDEANGVAI